MGRSVVSRPSDGEIAGLTAFLFSTRSSQAPRTGASGRRFPWLGAHLSVAFEPAGTSANESI